MRICMECRSENEFSDSICTNCGNAFVDEYSDFIDIDLTDPTNFLLDKVSEHIITTTKQIKRLKYVTIFILLLLLLWTSAIIVGGHFAYKAIMEVYRAGMELLELFK